MKRIVIGFLILLGAEIGMSQTEAFLIKKALESGLTIAELRQQAKREGINNEEDFRRYAESRGIKIPEDQERIIAESQQQAEEEGINVSGTEKTAEEELEKTEPEGQKQKTEKPETLPYFGYDFFKSVPNAFKPDEMGPVDEAYIVGPGDELFITLSGATELRLPVRVDKEGCIFVPNIGQILVAGKRFDKLSEYVKEQLSSAYSKLETGDIKFNLTVMKIRPIKVFALGDVEKPGGHEVSSGSPAFNLLYSIGGPKVTGSLRKIEARRDIGDGYEVDTIDVYDYLLKGFSSDEVRLSSNSRIFVPPRGKTVAISGSVKRPAIYELTDDEDLSDLMEFCGGPTADAYSKRFQIERIIPYEERDDPSIARKILDVGMEDVLSGKKIIPLYDGDKIRILSILPPLKNEVNIRGAVKQPGRYELSDSCRTVRDLILQADSLTGDAYTNKAELTRTNEDSTKWLISLNLKEVMADIPTQNIPLVRMDELYVYSIQELEAEQKVNIEGSVRNPGTYPLKDSMTVYDLLFKGGGLTDQEFLKEVYLERADLLRKTRDGKDEIVIPFNLDMALNKKGFGDTLLRPKDRIQVYSRYVDETVVEKYVFISGGVKDPGRFSLQENMTLEDLIIRSGGFAEGSDMTRAEISRIPGKGEKTEPDQRSLNFVVNLKDNEIPVSFAMDDTMRFSRETRMFLLRHRDMVYIRTDPDYKPQETVKILGEVYFPGEYALRRENEKLSDVLQRAGGIRTTAYPKGGRLFRENVRLITKFDKVINGSKRSDVLLSPGDSIVIPTRPNTVEVRGDISNAGLLKYEKKRVSYYLKKTGGSEGKIKSVYITQANGSTYSLKRGLMPDKNPRADDGSVITVVQKTPRDKKEFDLGKTITNVASITSSIVFLAYLISLI